jgi:hypothetical protein
MKITKLHIFLILLIALVLCSCLGICSSSTKEGYTSSTYDNYGKYYSDLNDENISATDWSQGLDDNDDKFNKKDDRRYNGKYDDRNSYRKGSYSYKDDLNGGDKNDSSTYMISTSFKKNKKYDDYNNNDDNNPRRRNDIFSSVSNGAVNGSLFSNFNNNDDDDDNNDNNDDNNNGVTRDQIPNGQEDLYILKSQALTPICPACPAHPKIDCDKKCNSKSKCPPCPPCARCPEPQFDCVKVPNYNTTGLNQNLPIPWMAKL